MATYQACQVIGLPECRLNLAVSLTQGLLIVPHIADIKAAPCCIPCRGTKVDESIHSVFKGE
jgi:hypothetical protein